MFRVGLFSAAFTPSEVRWLDRRAVELLPLMRSERPSAANREGFGADSWQGVVPPAKGGFKIPRSATETQYWAREKSSLAGGTEDLQHSQAGPLHSAECEGEKQSFL